GHALLEERLLVDALHEALEHHRASARAAQRALGDVEIVPHHVELGEPGLGEHHLVGTRHAHLVPVDLEDLCRRLRWAHAATLATAADHDQGLRPTAPICAESTLAAR